MLACIGFSQHVAQCLTHNSLSNYVKSKQILRLDSHSGIVKRECYNHGQGGKDSTQMLKSSLLTVPRAGTMLLLIYFTFGRYLLFH